MKPKAQSLEIGGVGRMMPFFRGRGISEYLAMYDSCLNRLVSKAQFCIDHHLTNTCLNSRVRAIKTVRATSDIVEPLLQKDPDFRVIHLMRDPRGVVKSRMASSWSQGRYEKNDPGKLGSVFCQRALKDHGDLELLKNRYPQTGLTVVLENFVRYPERQTRAIFEDFLQLPASKTMLDKLDRTMRVGFVDKWKKSLRPIFVQQIDKACKNFFSSVKYFQRH